MTEQAFVFLIPLALRLNAQRIETNGMHSHHFAKAPHLKFVLYFLNESAPYPDVLANYTRTLFDMSRSSVTRFNLSISRCISSGRASRAYARLLGRHIAMPTHAVDSNTKSFGDFSRWVSAIDNLLDCSDLKFFRATFPTRDFSFA